MKKIYQLVALSFLILISQNSFSSLAWDQMADFGGGVREAGFGFSIGSYGYAGTGRNPGDNNDFWQYDPSTNVWTQKANYSGLGRYGMIGFSIGNFGYAGTGWSGAGGGNFQYKDFWQYDPATNSWTQKTDFGGTERYAAVAFTIGNKGYVGLGYTPSLADFWEYDPVGDTWTQKTNFPQEREGAIAFSIGSKGYVGMGYDVINVHHNDLYEFDPVANTWTQKSNLPGLTRRASVGFALGNYGYVGMGYNDTAYLTDFFRYDPIGDTWSNSASIGGVPRYWSFAFTIDNYGYVGTGSYFGVVNPIRTSDFWRLGDCDGSSVGIRPNPIPTNYVSMTVNADHRSGLILDYNLAGERDVVFDFYNTLGQIILSVDLLPNTSNKNLALSLCEGIYIYSVSNHQGVLRSGKVVVN